MFLKFPKRTLAKLPVFLLLAVAGIYSVYQAVSFTTSPHYSIRNNLVGVLAELATFETRNGHLPYSADGPDRALYEMHAVLDASAFEGDSGDFFHSRTYWDHQKRTLVNSVLSYLNDPAAKMNSERIILTTKPKLISGGTYIGTGDGVVHWIAGISEKDLTGKWLTWERLLIEDSRVLCKWRETHQRLTEPSWRTEYDKRERLVRVIGMNVTIDYNYSSERLTSCIVTLRKGVITERVSTDEIGCVVDVERSPPEWRLFLPPTQDATSHGI